MEGPDLSADVEAFTIQAYSVKRLAAAGHRSNSQLGMGRLQTLAERKLVLRKTSGADRRQSFLSLTAPGRKAMGKLEKRNECRDRCAVARHVCPKTEGTNRCDAVDRSHSRRSQRM